MSGDPTRVGLFTGAGISSGPPARLPLGRTFHRLLRAACEERARTFAPDIVGERVLAALRGGNWNLLARIENTVPGVGRGAVHAMRIEVPNEEHLLAAIHLARGGYHVTVNFDDGLELAYGLLAGRRSLSAAFPDASEAVLAWRQWFPTSVPELTVISRPDQFARRHYRSRPLLVKLHGSLGEAPDGVALSLPVVTDEPDIVDLGGARRAALDELARHPFVLVTGFSGGDPASTSPVMRCLGRTSFAWVAPEVRHAVRATVSSLDPSQPQIGYATEILRGVLDVNPPSWPADHETTPFKTRFDTWLEALPVTVGAEVVAWSLSDAGFADEAVELLDRAACADGRARTRLRLADALARRATPRDRAVARRLLLRLLVSADPDVRRVASLRLAAHLAGLDGSRTNAVKRLPAHVAVAGLAAAAGLRAMPRARTREAAVRAGSAVQLLERDLLREAGGAGWGAPALDTATRTLRALRGALSGSAGEPSGRRRAQLRRQAVEVRAIAAILRGRPLRDSALGDLDEIAGIFAHLSDSQGRADTVATRALVLAGRGADASARTTLRQAERIGASTTLIELVERALARDRRAGYQAEGTASASAAMSSTTSSSTPSSVPSSTSSSAP
jgi:hypothetical protein